MILATFEEHLINPCRSWPSIHAELINPTKARVIKAKINEAKLFAQEVGRLPELQAVLGCAQQVSAECSPRKAPLPE